MTLLKSIKSSQLNSGQKNKLSKLRKKSAINNGEKIFEEIFKKGNILPLLAGYLLRGYEKPLYLTTEWPSEWDMILRWYKQDNSAEKTEAGTIFGQNGTYLVCNAFTGWNPLAIRIVRLVYFVLNGFIRQSWFWPYHALQRAWSFWGVQRYSF